MARVPTEIIEILREPDLLAGEAYASLGAGVQEIVADFSELETPQPTVVATTHAVSALSATPDRATGRSRQRQYRGSPHCSAPTSE